MVDKASSPARSLADRASDLRSVLAILGGVVYAVLEIAYAEFYGPLGLSPGDLGLGYLDLLAQAAIGALALMATVGVFLSATAGAVAPALLVSRRLLGWDGQAPRGRAKRVFATVGVIVMVAVVLIAYWLILGIAIGYPHVGAIPAGVLALYVTTGVALGSRETVRWAARRPNRRRWVRYIVAGFTIFCAVAAGYGLILGLLAVLSG